MRGGRGREGLEIEIICTGFPIYLYSSDPPRSCQKLCLSIPEEHARGQQVRAARQIVFHVKVVVAEFGADQLGRGEYAHPAGVRRARVARRSSDQLFARVEVRGAVGRALTQSTTNRFRITGHVRAVPPDAQVPGAPRPLLAVTSAEVQPENHRPIKTEIDTQHGQCRRVVWTIGATRPRL